MKTLGATDPQTCSIDALNKLRQVPTPMLKLAQAVANAWQPGSSPWQATQRGAAIDLGTLPPGVPFNLNAWCYQNRIFVQGTDRQGKTQWASLSMKQFAAIMR